MLVPLSPSPWGPAGRAGGWTRTLCLEEAPQAVTRLVVTDQGDAFSRGPTSGDRVPLPPELTPWCEAG